MAIATQEPLSDRDKIAALERKVESLEHQLDWFKRQLFGRKSEKRLMEDSPQQPLFKGWESEPTSKVEPTPTETITYSRRKGRSNECVTDTGLRFDETVPVETIEVAAPELQGPQAQDYEVIAHKETYRLAQRPGNYVVLKYVRAVLKHRASGRLSGPAAPASLWAGTVADVSLVAGLLVEKFVYHQPLYRQHQRMAREGVTLSRSTLTSWAHKGITLLEPIFDAQHRNVLLSKVLAIDETPIKAGREKKGKMRLAWYWPVYGEDDEVVFTYSRSRGHQHLVRILDGFAGTMLTDGHGAYSRYARKCAEVEHAQCWTHYPKSRFIWSTDGNGRE